MEKEASKISRITTTTSTTTTTTTTAAAAATTTATTSANLPRQNTKETNDSRESESESERTSERNELTRNQLYFIALCWSLLLLIPLILLKARV